MKSLDFSVIFGSSGVERLERVGERRDRKV